MCNSQRVSVRPFNRNCKPPFGINFPTTNHDSFLFSGNLSSTLLERLEKRILLTSLVTYLIIPSSIKIINDIFISFFFHNENFSEIRNIIFALVVKSSLPHREETKIIIWVYSQIS